MNNGFFEAAGYAYKDSELEAFTRPDDFRPKTFLKMDLARAQELSGYARPRR